MRIFEVSHGNPEIAEVVSNLNCFVATGSGPRSQEFMTSKAILPIQPTGMINIRSEIKPLPS